MDQKTTGKVVTRFAPSPTGFMHVGGVRTALYAWLWARKNNGTFILRIEDTDKKREVEGSIEHIIQSLKWLRIGWDEGVDIGGPHSPYKQSERLDTYQKYAQKLVEKGLAYADPYTPEELENFRKKAAEEKKPFLYRNYRPENPPAWDGTKPLRFKNPAQKHKWHDVVRGDLEAGEEATDDFILIKSDGYPTYNFAHIIDDLLMNVTHVMRADEFIASTPNYLALYEALEIHRPELVTLPPILGDTGTKKLGKRDGAKDILDYQKEGYLPEAMLNYLAFLGFNPGGEKEIFTAEELIEVFDLTKIQRSGARWSDDKLNWFNKEHMKLLPPEEVEKNILERLPDNMRTNMITLKIVPLIFERISKWGDIQALLENGELDFFYTAPPKIDLEKEKLLFKNTSVEDTKNNIGLAVNALTEISDEKFTRDQIKESLMAIADTLEKRGALLHPVRFALSGLEKSPDPFIIAEVIGKNETLFRLQHAQKTL